MNEHYDRIKRRKAKRQALTSAMLDQSARAIARGVHPVIARCAAAGLIRDLRPGEQPGPNTIVPKEPTQ